MTYSFNLIDQPWIPCITLDDELQEFGLRDFLAQAHELQEISCETPLMTAAMFPMLLALLHRIFGPNGTQDWALLWQHGRFPMQEIDAYFDEWYERFDLFHPEYPFYQAADDRVKPKSMIHLIHSIGNTGTLFTHANEEQKPYLPVAEAARHLLTAQTFRTAGLSGLPEKFTDSPLTRGMLFWATGPYLFETLMLNLYPVALTDMQTTPDDAPIWEQVDAFARRNYPKGLMDYLTWPSNRILLLPEMNNHMVVVNEMTIAPGLTMAADVFSPVKQYLAREDKKKGKLWSFTYFNPDKDLWRDYHTLLTLQDDNTQPPAVIEWFAWLASDGVLKDSETLQLVANGMLADQAKPIFYRQSKMPLPITLLSRPDYVALIAEAIYLADEVSSRLRYAVDFLAEHVLMRGGNQKPDKNDKQNLTTQWDVRALYWAALEPHFWRFIEQLIQDVPDAPEQWRDELKRQAVNALQVANQMSGTDAAALQGQVVAERVLNGSIKKLFNQAS